MVPTKDFIEIGNWYNRKFNLKTWLDRNDCQAKQNITKVESVQILEKVSHTNK